MTPEVIYLISSLLLWIGLIVDIRGLFGLVSAMTAPGDSSEARRKSIISLVVGAVMIALSFGFRPELGREGPALRLPVAWVYMPFPGWLALIGIVTAGYLGVQGYIEVAAEARRQKAISSIGWMVVGIIGFTWLKTSGGQAWIFRGYLPVDFKVVAVFVALGATTLFLMVYTARMARARGLAAKFAATLALIVGSLLFGGPLAWQLITSFKETRDQTTANGFIWVPQVQDVHPFNDTMNPLFVGNYDGQSVQAKIDTKLSDDRALFEVERPYSARGRRFEAKFSEVKNIPRNGLIFSGDYQGQKVKAFVTEEKENGVKALQVLEPASLAGKEFDAPTEKLEPVRHVGLRWENYTEALEWLPTETHNGLVYLNNTIILVVLNVLGTVVSCAAVGYGFARLRFPGRDFLFTLMLSTMMLPGAVTMMPQFLIFRSLGWIDTLHPLWVPSLFAGAFNVFLLKQFFSTIPLELEEAARIDGCGYLRTFWQVMLPQVQPALAAIGIWTFMGTWNNFMGPLIYISSPEHMPIVYALAMYNSERGGDAGLLMAFSTMAMMPVLLLFFFAQRFFIEGVQLSGLGGR